VRAWFDSVSWRTTIAGLTAFCSFGAAEFAEDLPMLARAFRIGGALAVMLGLMFARDALHPFPLTDTKGKEP
jgi:hypothetical protein